MVGRTLSHYKVLEEISRGGMGIVYRALDIKLNREVALKVLPPELVADPERKRRFVQEAQAAAAIKHPNIAVIYGIDESDGTTFIAMELIEGDKLRDLIATERLSATRVLDIAVEVAEGLARAHEKGIVHRDLKPSNIMVTEDGHAKIIDFGLAKLVEPVSTRGSEAPTVGKGATHPGQVLGTFNYMSPEQARGQEIDHRSDIFSFGIVLYEMLVGQPAFNRSSDADTLSAILKEPAPKLPAAISGCTAREVESLQRILDMCLAKEPPGRFPSVKDLSDELSATANRLLPRTAGHRPLSALLKEPRFLVPLVLGVVLVLGAVGLIGTRSLKTRSARLEAIPEIVRLVEQDDYPAAYALAEQVESYLANDPIFADLWSRFAVHTSIYTEPPGVEVFFKEYSVSQDEWTPLGRTPIESARLHRGVVRWRFKKAGFETAERSGETFNGTIRLSLSEGSLPPDEMRVPATNSDFLLTGFNRVEVAVPQYSIDRYEVTNREFREFVESGGYRTRDYWERVTFALDGKEVSWENAIAQFRDRTGRPGPSTWQGGTFPEGEEDYPVRGVSWYEASAYAAFRGESLPTIYHWSRAAIFPSWEEVELQLGEVLGVGAFRSELVSLSNLSGDSASAVGNHRGVGPFGTYDMAGNVREWCWNATADSSGSDRYVLGGAWSDPTYLYTYGVAQSPWDRSETNGFRLVQVGEEDIATLRRPVERPRREEIPPISDEVFDVYRELYDYDRTDLNAIVESTIEENEHWRRETVSFDTAYGDERMLTHLFIPRNIDPPYQIVAYYPSSGAINRRTSEVLQMNWIDFIIMSGRAVAYPVLMGTYERNIGLDTTWPKNTKTYSDHVVKWIQDFRRTIDYLETRDDIDLNRLSFYGFSWGGWNGPIVLALDDRFKTGVFVSGGIPPTLARPEASSASFASRTKAPVLMISGKHDILRPVATFQSPMFESLGTPPEHKRHAILDGGHAPPRNQLVRETLDWLDRYLGPVQ